MIQFDPIWPNLIQFDPIWSNLIQFNQIWSNLFQFELTCYESVIFFIIIQEQEQQQQQQLSNSKDLGSKCPRSKNETKSEPWPVQILVSVLPEYS